MNHIRKPLQIAALMILAAAPLRSAVSYTEKVTFDSPSPLDSFAANADYSASGGVLIPPVSQLSHLEFEKRIAPILGSVQTLSVDFYYDPAAINNNADRETATLQVSSDSTSFTCNVDMLDNGLGALSTTGNAAWDLDESLDLAPGWHRVAISFTFSGGTFGDQIDVAVTLHSLEANTQILKATQARTIYDINMMQSENLAIRMAGNQWGGSTGMDNFDADIQTNDAPLPSHPDFDTAIERAVKISWQSRAESTYRVEYSENLESEGWELLKSGIEGTGERLSVYDSSTELRRFYRVHEE